MSRTALQGMLLMLVLFVLGTFSGIAIDRVWLRPRCEPHEHHHHDPERLAEQMRTDLGLSEDQFRVVKAAMREAKAEIESVKSVSFPKIRAALQRSRAKIVAVLTPKQAERFMEMSPPNGKWVFGKYFRPGETKTGTAAAPSR